MPFRWLLTLLLTPSPPETAVEVRLVRPDVQVERVIDLFQGSRAASPAAALAGWRRKTGQSLSKGTEAIIALLNPESARELKVFDGASFAAAFDPRDGQPHWRATIPRDDGSVAALATALALTDGASEAPLADGAIVDRLGPLGSPLMAQSAKGVVLAGSRDDLTIGLEPFPSGRGLTMPSSGIALRFDPARLSSQVGPVSVRQLAAGFTASGCRGIEGVGGIEEGSISVRISSRWERPADRPPIDPSWLDEASDDQTIAAFAVTLDPKPESWDRLFAAADRVEKADPERAKLAPLRTRLNLLALGGGIRPEVDLWPRLSGVSGGLRRDERGGFEGSWLALHAIDEPSAKRLAEDVAPRLERRIGHPLAIRRDGRSVRIQWGEGPKPAGKPRSLIGVEKSSTRCVVVWPGRIPGMPDRWSAALAASPPILWSGSDEGETSIDEIRWSGLRAAIRAFLADLPMTTAPQGAAARPE